MTEQRVAEETRGSWPPSRRLDVSPIHPRLAHVILIASNQPEAARAARHPHVSSPYRLVPWACHHDAPGSSDASFVCVRGDGAAARTLPAPLPLPLPPPPQPNSPSTRTPLSAGSLFAHRKPCRTAACVQQPRKHQPQSQQHHAGLPLHGCAQPPPATAGDQPPQLCRQVWRASPQQQIPALWL